MFTANLLVEDNCGKKLAGIDCAWFTECKNVLDLVFDATDNNVITAIIMDAAQADPTFKKVEFPKNTAFFSQPKTGDNKLVNQILSFILEKMDPFKRRQLELLGACCCLHIIIKDCTGQYHYMGVEYDPETGLWSNTNAKTGDGSGETGTVKASDSNQYTETIIAETCFYAPYYTGGEASIPT